MIYEFKSRATATVIMTQPVAEIMLEAIDHAPGKTGVITVEQLPGAIAALKKLADDNPAPPAGASNEQDDDAEQVAIARRALPLIEMFEESLAAGKNVSWGV